MSKAYMSGDELPVEDGGRVHMRFVRDPDALGMAAEILACQ